MNQAVRCGAEFCRCRGMADLGQARTSQARFMSTRHGTGATLALPRIFQHEATVIEPVVLLGIPVDFILFALTLLGVALFHRHTLPVALTGLAAIIVYKLAFTGFKFGAGLGGLGQHMAHEWVMLANLFVLSSFLDNIAAALIGGTVARHVFQGKVHIGYLAAIVAASNAGGSGSVVGDTTTTMMWIAGVSPLSVLEAYV